MMKVSMIARSIVLALVTTAIPSVHAASTWTEARNDAMGGTGERELVHVSGGRTVQNRGLAHTL